MRWSEVPFQPSPATLRRFAFLGALLLAALAGWRALRHADWRSPWDCSAWRALSPWWGSPFPGRCGPSLSHGW